MNNTLSSFNKDEIILFYYSIPIKINNETIQSLISTLSVFEQNKLYAIKHKNVLKQRLFGSIILKHIAVGLGIVNAEYVSLTISGKPFFTLPNGFDFNISHSGNMVVCCLAKDSIVGIDLELIRPVNIEVYKNYFDLKEWDIITKSDNSGVTFFRLWVRKEAIIKADGRGIGIELSSLNCLKNIVITGSNTYFIENIDIDYEYTCAIACSEKKTIKLTDFDEIFNTKYNLRL